MKGGKEARGQRRGRRRVVERGEGGKKMRGRGGERRKEARGQRRGRRSVVERGEGGKEREKKSG